MDFSSAARFSVRCNPILLIRNFQSVSPQITAIFFCFYPFFPPETIPKPKLLFSLFNWILSLSDGLSHLLPKEKNPLSPQTRLQRAAAPATARAASFLERGRVWHRERVSVTKLRRSFERGFQLTEQTIIPWAALHEARLFSPLTIYDKAIGSIYYIFEQKV